jgi:hypothetical protein
MSEGKFVELLKQYDEKELDDFAELSVISGAIIDSDLKDEHFQIIQERLRVVWEVFTGILSLVAIDLPVSGLTHCRSLYENVLATLYLLYDKGKIQDYLEHAKIIAFELSEAFGRDPKQLDVVRADYEKLKPNFLTKKKRTLAWHKMSMSELADKVDELRNTALGDNVSPRGIFPHMQAGFYKEASSLSHGEGFLGMRFDRGWKYDVKNYRIRGPRQTCQKLFIRTGYDSLRKYHSILQTSAGQRPFRHRRAAELTA